jgi:hypothetical protein
MTVHAGETDDATRRRGSINRRLNFSVFAFASSCTRVGDFSPNIESDTCFYYCRYGHVGNARFALSIMSIESDALTSLAARHCLAHAS